MAGGNRDVVRPYIESDNICGEVENTSNLYGYFFDSEDLLGRGVKKSSITTGSSNEIRKIFDSDRGDSL